MKTIRIGARIASLRHARGLTQEDLAGYLGVSKPAVSKWESEQSYPDITLLPVLASYFDITVDELLDYQPQLGREPIRQLYRQLSETFANGSFDTALAQCRENIRKYYSCWPLLLNMGILLMNHASMAGDPGKTQAILEEAGALFERVQTQSDETGLSRQARCCRAGISLLLGHPEQVIDLLEDIREVSPISAEVLLASAWQMRGDTDRAIGLLQGCIYTHMATLLGIFPNLLSFYGEDPERLTRWLRCAQDIVQSFGADEFHPMIVLPIHLQAANLYALAGLRDQALDQLEQVARLVTQPGVFPLNLRGSALFDHVEGLFNELDLGTDAPRSDSAVRQSIHDAVTHSPIAQTLGDDERFQALLHRIQTC